MIRALEGCVPSCGSSEIYDGTFTRTLVAGAGVTAEGLRAAGMEVRSDEDLDDGRSGRDRDA